MIDLRSDTVTKPTVAMRSAMSRAEVGDDVFGEDPSVNDLEQHVADLFGHEAALFCVTGSLSNFLAIRNVAEPGDEALCDANAHIARFELGAHSALGGVSVRTWSAVRGIASLEAIDSMMSVAESPYVVRTAVVAIENTHSFAGGAVQPLEHLRVVSERCRSRGVALHLDGARLWNASVASGTALRDYGELFESLAVCFSKGLGAPIGSMLISSADRISSARLMRKRLGAGWRQAGILAAAARYAVDHHVQRLAEDHENARVFADAITEATDGAVVSEPVETNIVVVDTGVTSSKDVVAAAGAAGVLLCPWGRHAIRAVTHLDVSGSDCRRAGKVTGEFLSPGRGAA